jgi:hypothetical protein
VSESANTVEKMNEGDKLQEEVFKKTGAEGDYKAPITVIFQEESE